MQTEDLQSQPGVKNQALKEAQPFRPLTAGRDDGDRTFPSHDKAQRGRSTIESLPKLRVTQRSRPIILPEFYTQVVCVPVIARPFLERTEARK